MSIHTLDRPRPVDAPTRDLDDMFSSTYRNYRPMVRQVILNQLANGDTYLADDLAQDTFLALYRYRNRVDFDRSPGGLLMTMARNSISKYYRAGRNNEMPTDTGDPGYTNRALESRGAYVAPATSGRRSEWLDLTDRPGPVTAGRRQPARKTLAEVFAEKTELGKNGCVLWTGSINNQGAPMVSFGGAAYTAQRLAYMKASGALIPERHAVKNTCHAEDEQCEGGPSCLHRRCVNPQHLRLQHQPGRRRAKRADHPA